MDSLLSTSPILHIVNKINELITRANEDKNLLDGFRTGDNTPYNLSLDKTNINGYIYTVKMAGLYKISLTASSGSVDFVVNEGDPNTAYTATLNTNNLVLDNVLLLNGDYLKFTDRFLPTGATISIELQKNLVKAIFDSAAEAKSVADALSIEIATTMEIATNYNTARQDLVLSKAQYEDGLVALDTARRELEGKIILINNIERNVNNINISLTETKTDLANTKVQVSQLVINKADKATTDALQANKLDKTGIAEMKRVAILSPGTTDFTSVKNDTLIFVRDS